MGLLSNMFGKSKPFDADAAEARAYQLRTLLPTGATVNVMEPSKGIELTYFVDVVGDRAQTSALLASVVEIVQAGEERWSVEFSVHDTADENSTYSSFDLPDSAVKYLDTLTRAHDELYAIIPAQSIRLDGMDGGFHIYDVPRGDAMGTARAAVRWWEGVLRDTEGWWSDSVLSVNIGGEGDNAEIIYGATVEREPDPMGYNKTATGSKRVSDTEWAQRVFAAWNDNLPALEAMLRLPVPSGHEVEFSFTDAKLKPRLSVAEYDTYEDNDAAAEELVTQIKAHVPDTQLKAS